VMKEIRLGDRVKDQITGVSGIVTAYTYWLFGCERVTIQPEEAKDGRPAESFCADAAQCRVMKAGVVTGYNPPPATIDPRDTSARPAGPRQDARRQADPVR
jgi:hypothetical protein